ncbi:MAG: VWA domain-containing protein [Proteobacteria bacterium]|jgi:hypothetical protein|nr:VWA domain-containing protein [Pseudomonadota bacterium]
MKKIEAFFIVLFGVPVLLALQGCWMMAPWGDHGHGTDADTDSDSDSDSDTECEETVITVLNDPARVLILLDHSSSMAGTNWDIARSAIGDLLSTFASSSIEFGLDTLPDPQVGECSVEAPVAVDCGPGTEAAINGALAGMSTFVSTPLYDAMAELTEPGYAPGCMETEHAKHLLLIADGEDSCSTATPGDFAALTSALVGMGVRITVVGFNVNIDSGQLEAIAANGGTEFTSYLNASDESSLNAALGAIADSVDSCLFTIAWPAASAEPGLVNFYFDGLPVPMDEDCSTGFGWRWAGEAHTQIEFCEGSCELLKDGAIGELRATFGCETIGG